jgi:hypothetical protein
MGALLVDRVGKGSQRVQAHVAVANDGPRGPGPADRLYEPEPDAYAVPGAITRWAGCELGHGRRSLQACHAGRVKRQGMRWKPRGFLDVLASRMARLSGTFQPF